MINDGTLRQSVRNSQYTLSLPVGVTVYALQDCPVRWTCRLYTPLAHYHERTRVVLEFGLDAASDASMQHEVDYDHLSRLYPTA